MARSAAAPRTILALFASVCVAMASIEVDLRCYCNLPACVTTGHMCRSSARTCLSEKGGDSRGVTWRHACLELVSRQETLPDFCSKNTTRHCCAEDMCNYPKKGIPFSFLLNHSHVTGHLSDHDTSHLRGGNPSVSRSWFQVTVAAVPVAGVAILLVLIVMATRMLRAGASNGPQIRRKISRQTRCQKVRGEKPLPKSLSCVVVDRGHSSQPVVRSCASMGSLGISMGSLSQSMSLAFSTGTGCSDSSREKYFVFDV